MRQLHVEQKVLPLCTQAQREYVDSSVVEHQLHASWTRVQLLVQEPS